MGIIVAEKDIPTQQNLLGQFLTNDSTAAICVDAISTGENYFIEPSCGKGVFLDLLRKKYPNAEIKGIELDQKMIDCYNGKEKTIQQNFYDLKRLPNVPVCFIGNPPYHSPAYSLSERPQFVKDLLKKYDISNMREESVIFFVHTVDLILTNNIDGSIHYILPKALFDNNSKAYLSFKRFLRKHLRLLNVIDLTDKFDGVNRDLVFVSMQMGSENKTYQHNGKTSLVSEFYRGIDYTPFQEIFKKTNLGSVPCESIFLSVRDEPKLYFAKRIHKLFASCITLENLLDHLKYKGDVHLTSLKKNSIEKAKVVLEYINEIKTLPEFGLSLFEDVHNYKHIQHRNEKRFYFRHHFLKKGSFIYEINRDPCPSFYFPGNPNKGSTDYFGFCEYDVNRNSSPGANRTIPLKNIEENLQDEFKKWWRQHTELDCRYIYHYLLHISKSDWYKNLKKTRQRFYFGIPNEFDGTFLDTIKNLDYRYPYEKL